MCIVNLKRLFTCILCLIIAREKLCAQSFYPPVGIAVQISPGIYNLTPGAACDGTLKSAALWSTTMVDFNTSFTLKYKASFDIVLDKGADGIVAVFGSNIIPTSSNAGGHCLGYYDQNQSSANADFQNSFGVECDIYPNDTVANDPDNPYFDHLMIPRDGNFKNVVAGGNAVQADPANTSIKSGILHEYKIEWICSLKVLKVYFDNTLRLSSNFDYRTIFTDPSKVKWGFTAAIAGSCSNQILRDIQLVVTDLSCLPDAISIKDTLVGCRTVVFTAFHLSTNPVAYTWHFGDGGTATGDSVKHTYASPGNYFVKATNSNGATTTIPIIILPGPVIVASNDAAICKGDSIQLHAGGGAAYHWTPETGLNNANIADPIAKLVVTAKYIVTGFDQYGCTNQDSVQITVWPGPILSITNDGSHIDCKHSSVQLFVNGAKEYSWQPAEYCDNAFSSQPVVSPSVTTEFIVRGKGGNGCYSYDSIIVRNEKEPVIFVPDIFTPNGDGLNDEIYPVIYCDFTFDHFSIYNRWGAEVFSTSIYQHGWDGKYKGEPQDMGTYRYLVTGYSAAGNKVIFKGDITLLR